MTNTDLTPTNDPDDLEELEVEERVPRVVLSVRLDADDAKALAEAAEMKGVSLSEFARDSLHRSLAASWTPRVSFYPSLLVTLQRVAAESYAWPGPTHEDPRRVLTG